MAVYEKWQSERYSIGCKVWEARCPNCHELVESADPISSNYRFCPYCGFDMKSDFQRVADRRQFIECLMELKEAKRLLKAAVEDVRYCMHSYNPCEVCSLLDKDGECPATDDDDCKEKYKWRYEEEAKKLIGDSENG